LPVRTGSMYSRELQEPCKLSILHVIEINCIFVEQEVVYMQYAFSRISLVYPLVNAFILTV